MSALISREAVIKDLITNFVYHYPLFDGSRLGAKDYLVRREDVVAFLLKCPTIDAEPVRHGRWVKAQGMMPPEYRHRKCCYLCGGLALQDLYGRERLSYYCPHCGVKMDGGAEDDHQGT